MRRVTGVMVFRLVILAVGVVCIYFGRDYFPPWFLVFSGVIVMFFAAMILMDFRAARRNVRS